MKFPRVSWYILVPFIYFSLILLTRTSLSYLTDKAGEDSTIGKFSDFIVSNYYSKLNGKQVDKYLFVNPQLWAPKKSDIIYGWPHKFLSFKKFVFQTIKRPQKCFVFKTQFLMAVF